MTTNASNDYLFDSMGRYRRERFVAPASPRDRVATLFAQWQSGQSSKYDFYGDTMNHTPKLIAEVTGIDIDVIKDRRRYLRQLEKQSEAWTATFKRK